MKTSIRLSVIFMIFSMTLLLSACGGDSPSGPGNPENPETPSNPGDNNSGNSENSTTGTLKIIVATTGSTIDSDGYSLNLDGDSVAAADTNDTVFLENQEQGDYDVELTGISGNCSADGNNPKNATVSAGDTTEVSFDLSCKAAIVNQIAYSREQEIWIMNADGSAQTQLTDNNVQEINPNISPDGTKILFAKKTGGVVSNWKYFTINADGTNEQELTTESEGASISTYPFASWSPDGNTILFTTSRDGNSEIYSMDADGSNQTNLTNNAARDELFKGAFSSDGSEFAFTSDRDGDKEVFTANSDGSNQQQITTNTDSDEKASWSTKDDVIAFVTDRNSSGGSINKEIYTMKADGSNQQRLTNDTNVDSSPVWSADGTEITFESNRPGTFDIYTAKADGSGTPANLTNTSMINDRSPSRSLVQ